MAGVRFTDVQARPTAFLDFTSVTLDEFQTLAADDLIGMALIGFQGRGFDEVVQLDFCHELFLEVLLFQ